MGVEVVRNAGILSVERVIGLMVICMIGGSVALADQPPLPDELGHIRFEGGNGSALEQAVVILGAENTKQGIAAEKAWLEWKYQGSAKQGQQLTSVEERHYDVISIKLSDGSDLEIWFDITDFFGKW